MSVGSQPNSATIDNALTNLALQMRNVMQSAVYLSLQVNGGGNGLTVLEGYGYSAGDAAAAQNMIAYLNTVAQVYFGNLQQGGSGGTGASQFNFNQALSGLWNAVTS